MFIKLPTLGIHNSKMFICIIHITRRAPGKSLNLIV